jgi:hypothetical protein
LYLGAVDASYIASGSSEAEDEVLEVAIVKGNIERLLRNVGSSGCMRHPYPVPIAVPLEEQVEVLVDEKFRHHWPSVEAFHIMRT